jgi:prolyl-tRNA synthetase
MKYRALNIQTQREAPNNARTPGFGFLVRAGYMRRESEILPLGEQAISRLRRLSNDPSFFSILSIPIISTENETFFPISIGMDKVVHCKTCNYAERHELAQFKKTPFPQETELPLEKILTPDCNTIESLANFLAIPKEKTAKALMYTRLSDGKFIFVVVRGDMQLSKAKLKKLTGEVRPATTEEIIKAGAVPGYASPLGLKDALVIADELIPQSHNLAAGANEAGYHFKNVNYPRDYSAEIVADLVQAQAGDGCPKCGNPLAVISCLPLAAHKDFDFGNILLAIAETHHDDKGLTLPKSVAPFDVYLMQAPGKTINTTEKAEAIYELLQSAGISVLFDDRDERAGVKFNDADLIGCPIRVTVGEKALQNGMVELKPRKEKDNKLVQIEKIIEEIQNLK